ncbi:hypothetical protein PTTG_26730 [Puccinia triticina 1-1 BBBD Race 1]|uniref:Uncharacterized protein n=1 Tax=Puccinia triticina (isolate 1-1 / race 1 (BBBD)) TaxID=630390 RepID=A0A180GS22_PUCT1|nr:hypothetical protein PTTG_26730 [Puccinia triticina 1-1 BBBD Race 1]
MRETAVKFRRGLFTITRYFGIVLESLVAIYPNYVKFDMEMCQQPEAISENPKYKAFKNALGALNRVFVPATVPAEIQSARKSDSGRIALLSMSRAPKQRL